MEFTINRILDKTRNMWLTSYILSGFLIISFFVKETTHIYYLTAKPVFYLALGIAFIAALIEWYKSYKIKSTRQLGLSLFLSVVLIIYWSLVATFYIGTHSGV